MNDAAEDWLQDAAAELDTAEYPFRGDREMASAFHLYQAAEKALKALVIAETGDYPRTHDLLMLYEQSDAPAEHYDALKYLNPAYTATRYPDTGSSFEARELEDRIGDVEALIAWIRKR